MRIATKSSKLDISKLENTKKISDIFVKNIFRGDIILFYGEVGVGKTTFIKFLINGLQKIDKIDISEITSPTFSLMNQYKLNEYEIYHYDLYRLNSEKDILSLNIFEDFSNKVILIEWPEILDKLKPRNTIDINFEYGENFNSRYLTISAYEKLKIFDEFKSL
ncbi:tRNA (adenosine(37)-N6)-threonylcarbamoyltransferase complex ATPase subunit type 1 TsaE [Candidatus Pelagibacter sp.]|nr:tRNA (adenosine(37)-N6)-threonylcarbamoyltransferase complex ATPase subunit type 1 TsaE [Candidatus Pelagibacter sp.]